MEFATKYSDKVLVESNPGSRYKDVLAMRYDKDGKEVMEVVDQVDVYESIQVYEPEVNLQNIIARYMAGDESALDSARAFYGDVSQIPVNMQDILNLNMRGREIFEQLPTEIKQAFDNDYFQFLVNPERINDVAMANSADVPGDVVSNSDGTGSDNVNEGE